MVQNSITDLLFYILYFNIVNGTYQTNARFRNVLSSESPRAVGAGFGGFPTIFAILKVFSALLN
jgi:hypothetical protein